MAEAIRVVADLYERTLLPKPKSYAAAFPDLLTFHDAPTSSSRSCSSCSSSTACAHLPGHLPRQPRLRALVRLERDAARPDRDPRDAEEIKAKGASAKAAAPAPAPAAKK
jgi:hypothetical protein